MNDKEKVTNLHEALAEFVARSEEEADKYLEDESINFETVSEKNLSDIYSRLSEYKLKN